MREGLSLRGAPNEPVELFRAWFEQAQAVQAAQPRAMTLATVDALGRPAARMVILAGFDEHGFDFTTDARSPKIEQTQRQPWVALVFFWAELERQVRVEGKLAALDAAAADRYFYARSREAQLATWAAQQSQALASREVLEASLLERLAQFEGKPVPRPPYYTGFRIEPARVEFWQARTDRLNDRLRYERAADGTWTVELLAP
jgi:pyridoxamine 5'-phosphate oxidase